MEKKPLIIAAAVVAVIALAGGGFALTRSDSDDTASPTTSSSTSSSDAPTTTAASGPVSPLTGLPQPDEAIRNRPLLTIKIDNSPDARPQFGIEKADDIVEEKVEGSISRFMALFQSQDSSQVGPVRSLRTTDPAWLKPEGGMISYSGGIPEVRAGLKSAGITDVGGDTYGTKYYKRRSDRPFEHSMYTMTPVLRELTPKGGLPAPRPLYEYLKAGEAFGGTTATPLTTVSGQMGPGAIATKYSWTYDAASHKYFRSTDGKPHLIENVGQISMTNVIIQYTPYRPTKYADRAGSVVDEALTTGLGDAWIISDGKYVQAKWNRPTENDVTTFTDSAGVVVKLQPGQTWLQLVPQDIRGVATP